jgi:hypothetical protein
MDLEFQNPASEGRPAGAGFCARYAGGRLPPELVDQARYRDHDPGVERGKAGEQ